MSLARDLWIENRDLADRARDSEFVRGLAAGSLPLESFQRYIVQDAFFLDAFVRAYALALAGSRGWDSIEAFARLIAGVVDEIGMHERKVARWGVSLDAVQPVEVTRAYAGFLIETASRGDTGLTCAAMTPCMRLYAHLGQNLAWQSGNTYGEWIETYASGEFEAMAQTLESLLDRHAADGIPIHEAYRRAMQLEVAFFEAFNPGA